MVAPAYESRRGGTGAGFQHYGSTVGGGDTTGGDSEAYLLKFTFKPQKNPSAKLYNLSNQSAKLYNLKGNPKGAISGLQD